MARTIKDIKKSMTDIFMSDPTLRNAYGISDDNAKWQDTFSNVSIENILLYIVAVCAYSIEVLFDQLKVETEQRFKRSVVASVGWYHSLCVNYQHGDQLIYNEVSQTFGYEKIDTHKQIIKYAAVRDLGGCVQILVAKDADGNPARLTSQELESFKAYMSKMKIAGVSLNIKSLEADAIMIDLIVKVDKSVIGADGKRISDGSMPIVQAINNYCHGIIFGGVFNKNKLIDAVQSVPGVVDCELVSVKTRPARAAAYKLLETNDYTAVGGCLICYGLENIRYE